MKKKVLNYIQMHRLIQKGETLIIGVSGGADSVCLLHLLVNIKETMNIQLQVIHIHHGLRGIEADRDAAFVEELCKQWGVPCFVIRKDVTAFAKSRKLSEEEAGRILRYEVFCEYAERDSKSSIVIAHHKDDVVETILHNFVRGSGLRGLSGISVKRGRIIRPLLCCTRVEILEYLKQSKVAFCEDSTNQLDLYTRNKIRLKLIPVLNEVNNNAQENILNTAEIMREADEFFEQEAEQVLEQFLVESADGVGIDINILKSYKPVIQKYIIMKMLDIVCGGRKDLGFKHVQAVLGLADKEVGKKIALPYEQTAWKDYKILWIEHKKQIGVKTITGDVPVNAFQYQLILYQKHMKIPKNKYTKWFDYDKIKDALTIRWRQTGDYITLPDGGRKTVKSYMIDQKIPCCQREQIPLVTEGHHVLWIVGYRISEYFKVTEHTRKILQIQYDGGQKDEG